LHEPFGATPGRTTETRAVPRGGRQPSGLSKKWYWDLEDDPAQLLGNVSSAHLQFLGDPVRVSPLELITGSDELGAEPVDSWEIVELLECYRPSTGLTVEALSDEVGRELKDVLVDANELWNFCVDGLKDICNRLQLDWRRALPDLPPSLT